MRRSFLRAVRHARSRSAPHVAVVEVDPETGVVKFLRYVAVDDCGKIISPLLVEGQIHGGIAQGIAQALYEEVVYDENGQLITAIADGLRGAQGATCCRITNWRPP